MTAKNPPLYSDRFYGGDMKLAHGKSRRQKIAPDFLAVYAQRACYQAGRTKALNAICQ
jgi:hypothetical protein